MDSGHAKMRMNLEADRLSTLPDDLVHRILSSLNTKDVVRLCVLSPRWKCIWTSLPYLNFSTEDFRFSKLPKFSNFVTNVLSHRDNLAEVYSLKLTVRLNASHELVKRILNYAISHNIQQLNVVCLLENDSEFPLSLFSSESLKHLNVKMQISRYRVQIYQDCYLTSTWKLPTLTTLDLDSVILGDDAVLSNCGNLQNLRLNKFKAKESTRFSIVHPRLSNLTLENGCNNVKAVNIATPQLKNLTIRFGRAEYEIAAPELTSLLYKGYCPLNLTTDGFHSMEKADISISSSPDAYDHQQIVSMLQQLHNVKFLTLNLEVIEILSLSQDLILPQPSPFVNLRRLTIYPDNLHPWYPPEKRVLTMSTELKSYFLDSSPGSTVTMFLREEAQAQNIMDELRLILEKEKDSTKKNSTHPPHLEHGKAHVGESHIPKKLKVGGDVAPMNSYFDVRVPSKKVFLIAEKLESIKELVTKLPAPNRDRIEPCFLSLFAEAKNVIKMITDYITIQC